MAREERDVGRRASFLNGSLHLCVMDWKMKALISERLQQILNTQVRHCCHKFVWRCYSDQSETRNMQAGVLPQTVTLSPVRGVLKELYLIKWKQYTTVLMIFSARSRYEQRSQAILGPRTYDAVIATELNTVIPAKQLSSCSPGPTQALIM